MTNNYFKVISRIDGFIWTDLVFFDGSSMNDTMVAWDRAKEIRNHLSCGFAPRVARIVMFKDPRVKGEWSQTTLVGWKSREQMEQAQRGRLLDVDEEAA